VDGIPGVVDLNYGHSFMVHLIMDHFPGGTEMFVIFSNTPTLISHNLG